MAGLAVVVGDVSGKGLPAALLMSSLQAKVQMLRENNPSPGKAVGTLNRSLTERCPLGEIHHFLYALLDPASGVLEYSNAGHNYPLLLRERWQRGDAYGQWAGDGSCSPRPLRSKEHQTRSRRHAGALLRRRDRS